MPSDASLDRPADVFRRDLDAAVDIVMRLYQHLDELPVTPRASPEQLAARFGEPLPEDPQPLAEILEAVEHQVFAHGVFSLSPRFFGFINGSGNQAAVVAALLSAASNQICAKWQFSPSATTIERRVIAWISDFIGYPAAAGCLVSGGSMANLVALAAARRALAGFDCDTHGHVAGPPCTVYASSETHASIDKAMALLGMGRAHLRRIPVRADLTVDLVALEQRVADDRRQGLRPIAVVGNAGTTGTGAVDPLDDLADVCDARGLWLHVDGAYGAAAAGTRLAGDLFGGLSRADSVVVNPHKWLFVPVDAACILVRRPRALDDVFALQADYLRQHGDTEPGAFDFKDVSPELSRSFRALKVWMTFKAYGARALRAAIEHDIMVMRRFASEIDGAHDFVRLAPVPLSVVCFQYRGDDPGRHDDDAYLNALNRRLLSALERDGRVFLSGTSIGGRWALRACSVNHRLRQEDTSRLLSVVREVGTSLVDD